NSECNPNRTRKHENAHPKSGSDSLQCGEQICSTEWNDCAVMCTFDNVSFYNPWHEAAVRKAVDPFGLCLSGSSFEDSRGTMRLTLRFKDPYSYFDARSRPAFV